MKRIILLFAVALFGVTSAFAQVDHIYVGDQTIGWNDSLGGVVPGIDTVWWEVRGWNYSASGTMIESVDIETTTLFGTSSIMEYYVDWDALGLIRAEWQIAVRRFWTDGVETAWTAAGYSTVEADVADGQTFHSSRSLPPGLQVHIAVPSGFIVILSP